MASHLAQRALVRIAPLDPGEDAAGFLQGLVTNDVKGPLPCYAGLLTPQGKHLFDFLVWADGADILLDCEAAEAEALIKRLMVYRLRRRLGITREERLGVHWSPEPHPGAVPDPRLAALGWRWLGPPSGA
ncbi:MAG: folate-binding protein, partial [Erythrobacter cryptus]